MNPHDKIIAEISARPCAALSTSIDPTTIPDNYGSFRSFVIKDPHRSGCFLRIYGFTSPAYRDAFVADFRAALQ